MAIVFAMIMIVNCFAVPSFAEETEKAENVWHGDKLAVEVAEGKNGYTFMSVYQTPTAAYEMSNHMVSANGENHDIPQTLIMVPADTDYTWTPDGVYSFGNSNYETLYCCDAVTGYAKNTYYKRMNLEDSDYYDEKSAARIRAIVTNSYPFVSVERMKEMLADGGFAGASELTRAEIITAVQAAIWANSNIESGEYYYSRTFDVPSNTQWGGVVHDYTNEMDVWWTVGKRKFSTDEAVEARINSLIDYLKDLEEVYAQDDAIIITNIEILHYAPAIAKEGTYTVPLSVSLNSGGSTVSDDVDINVYVDDELYSTEQVKLGDKAYGFCVEAKSGQTIKATVSGKQILPSGVYFYEPEGGKDVSQCTVGVAAGETDVYSEASVVLEIPEEPASASIELKKIKWNGEAISGAGFSLYLLAEDEKLKVGDYSVGEDGYLKIENLVSGKYELVETTVPDGFLDPEESVEFEIDSEGTLNVKETELVSLKDGVIEFTNKLIPTEITLQGVKYLDGKTSDGFRFVLKRDGEIFRTARNLEDGRFDFGSISFAEVGKYKFTVSEISNPLVDNTIFDKSEFDVTVDVTESDNKLFAEVTIEKNGTAYDGEIRFDNYTSIDISGSKIWDDDDDREDLRPESVTVNLLSDGKTVQTVTVTEKDGWSFGFYDLPKYRTDGTEIEYTVSEEDIDGYTTVYDGFNIINTIIPEAEIVFEGVKYLNNESGEGFEFLLPDEIGKVLETVKSNSDGKFAFTKLSYRNEGVYKYFIRETVGNDEFVSYDNSVYTVSVKVEKIGKTLTASYTLLKNDAEYSGAIEFKNETHFETSGNVPPNEDFPSPGDGSNALIFLIVALSAIAFAAVLLKGIRKKGAKL